MRRSTILTITLALVCVAMPLVSAAHADSATVTVSREVEFDEASGVTDNVRKECTLQTRLPGFIKDFAKGMKIVLADDVSESTEGRVLHLTITNVIGPGGGAWSGSKSVTVKGELTENGEVLGSFIAGRYSGGGAFGGYKGTCSILGRCIKTIGKDIALWLKNPTMDARLGNA